MQLSVPAPVSSVYSEVDMRMQLAAAALVESRCSGVQCTCDAAFEKQVQRLGTRLSDAAFAVYPTLRERFERFEFVIADNNEPGSASSAAGTVAIFRGVQELHLSEEALGFVIGRDMGHVIDGHHDENSATSILFSVLVQVLLPVTNLMRGATSMISENAFAAATTTTAASFVGARAVRASNRPDQLREADTLALELLARQGWYGREVAEAMSSGVAVLGHDDWSDDLRASALRIDALTQGPPPPYAVTADRAAAIVETLPAPVVVGAASVASEENLRLLP